MAVYAWTSQSIIDDIFDKLNQSANSGFITSGFILRQLNLRQIDFAMRTKCLMKKSTISLTADTSEYELPDGFIVMDNIKYKTQWTMEYKDFWHLNREQAGANYTS